MGLPVTSLVPETDFLQRPPGPHIPFDDHRLDPMKRHRPEAVLAYQPKSFRPESAPPVLSTQPKSHLRHVVRARPVEQPDLPDRLRGTRWNDGERDAVALTLVPQNPYNEFPSGFVADPWA